MSLYMEHNRGGDDIIYGGQFEPTSSASNLILWECPDSAVGEDGLPISWVPTYKSAKDVVDALSNNDLRFRAAVGLPFEEWDGSAWNPVTPGTEFGPMLTRSMTVKEHPNKPHTWTIDVQESSMGSMLDSDGSAQGVAALSVNVTSRTRNVDAWRTGRMTMPADALDPDEDFYFDYTVYHACDSSQNSGGTELDINGVPVKTNVEQNVITIEWIVRSPYLQWAGTFQSDESTQIYANALALGNAVGGRNAEQLWYFPMGSLRCTDVAIQPLHHEFKRVVWTLVYDEWFHADQRPWMGKQGVIRTLEAPCDVEEGDSPIFFADAVFWRQPYLQAFTLGSNPYAYFPAGGWESAWAKLASNHNDYVAAYADPEEEGETP